MIIKSRRSKSRVFPLIRRMKSQHNILLRDTLFNQKFGDPNIGTVMLEPDFSVRFNVNVNIRYGGDFNEMAEESESLETEKE